MALRDAPRKAASALAHIAARDPADVPVTPLVRVEQCEERRAGVLRSGWRCKATHLAERLWSTRKAFPHSSLSSRTTTHMRPRPM